MLRRIAMALIVGFAMLTAGVPVLAAGIGELNVSVAIASGTREVSVFVVPDGLGYQLTQAREMSTPPTSFVDATITLTLLDLNDDPILGYPSEDMWLETSQGGLASCAGGAVADASTDVNGQTTFTGPFRAGGHSDRAGGEATQVVISGSPVVGYDLPLLFNSPDLDGSGVVNADDLILFAGSYQSGAYDYDADLFFDGLENLSDLVLFTGAYSTACP